MEKYLSGFSWAVSDAWIGALAAQAFDEGDVLYSSRQDARAGAISSGELAVQIRETTGSGWSQEISLSLFEAGFDKPQLIHTTFAGLFTLLWKGRVRDLEISGHPMPVPSTRLTRYLDDNLGRLVGEIDGPAFVMISDPLSTALAGKVRKLSLRLTRERRPLPSWLDAGDAEISPTADLAVFRAGDHSTLTPDRIREMLGLAAPKSGLFKLRPHGVLL